MFFHNICIAMLFDLSAGETQEKTESSTPVPQSYITLNGDSITLGGDDITMQGLDE